MYAISNNADYENIINGEKYDEIKALLISYDINATIYRLPCRITYLYIHLNPVLSGDATNLNQSNNLKMTYLPDGLKCLDLINYNGELPPLPNSIETLVFGATFTQKIEKYPSSLKVLKFIENNIYPHELPLLEEGIEHIEYPYNYEKKINFPSTLQIISLSDVYNEFPAELSSLSNVKRITFGTEFNHPLNGNLLRKSPLQVLSIRNRDATVNINEDFDIEEDLIISMAEIKNRNKYMSKFNSVISYFPNTLTKICLGDSYNQPIPKLPAKLKYIHFGYSFNQIIPVLPAYVSCIELGPHYNMPLPKLPASLIYIKLSPYYKKQNIIFPDKTCVVYYDDTNVYNSAWLYEDLLFEEIINDNTLRIKHLHQINSITI